MVGTQLGNNYCIDDLCLFAPARQRIKRPSTSPYQPLFFHAIPEEDKMLRPAVVLLAASCYLPACLAAASLFPVKLQFPAGQHPQLRAVEQCRKYWNKK